MWIIETTSNGEATAWELSRAVPRDKAGNPVEQGPLEPGPRGEREVIGKRDTLDTMLAFLKDRSGDRVRVGDVETAWAAAEQSGAAADRTVRVRGGAAPAARPVATGSATGSVAPARHSGPARPSSRPPPPSPWKGVALLVVLAIVAYVVFQFVK